MKREIDKVSINSISYDDFIRLYYLPEKPVILTDVYITREHGLTPEKMKQYFLNEDNREAGWYDAELPSERNQTFIIPSLVCTLLSREDISMRKKPMRAFMQPKGHKTLLHYDGNSLNGLNLQVEGEKEWTIISPNTPIQIAPFNFVASVSKYFKPNEQRHEFYNFKTLPGDMLFLPRYWLHEVTCLGDVNININWVFTPTSPNFSSKLGRREGELLKLRQMMPFIRKITVNGDERYGGTGTTLEKKYSDPIKTTEAFIRLLKELVATIPFLIYFRDIKKQATKFADNNFNVT